MTMREAVWPVLFDNQPFEVTVGHLEISLAADAPESTTGYSTTRLEMEVPMKCERHHNLADYGA
eukprot:scaffold34296_cov43-Cyclotella_meneghiniana.AAC.1